MKTAQHVFCMVLALAGAAGGCTGDFGHVPGRRLLVVDIIKPPNNPNVTGSAAQPLDLKLDAPLAFKIRVRALLPDGTQDPAFTSYVRIESKPGAIAPLTGPGADGRNVLLTGGASQPVDVVVTNAFGTSYLVATDLGYIPADPLRVPPPQCSDGIDNNGNGLVDFPADPGCAYANDDSEDGGTFDEGVSEPIFIHRPRIADARGLRCDPKQGCTGSGTTPFPKDQLLLDTGWHEAPTPLHPNGPGFDFDVVIVRVAADGFYATDVSDGQRSGPPPAPYTGYNSLFAYNFNAPPRMRVCDRVKALAGTASEFFGFTQISYPTWELEEWDPSKRACLVPEPVVLRPGDIKDANNLLRLTASLVRVETKGTITQVAAKVGPADTPLVKNDGKVCGAASPAIRDSCYVAQADATNCDFNHNGKIDFSLGAAEGVCSNDCDDVSINPGGCIEFSNFHARGTFKLLVTDENRQVATILADASAAAGFDVVQSRGRTLRAFTGTLSFFSGGTQFTIQARCNDDVIVDAPGAIPIDASKACVLPRTFLELTPQ